MKGKLKTSCIVIVGCLTLILSGCSLLPQEEEALKPPLIKPVKQEFEAVDVKLGTIAKEIKNSAAFVSKSQQQLFFKQSGSRLKSIDVHIGDSVKKGQVVASLDPGNTENDIYVQKLMLEKATLLYQQTMQSSANDAVTLHLKKIDIELAQNQLDRLQNQLAQTKLISQIDGVVTYLNNANEGDFMNAYSTVVAISDPKQLQLVAIFSNPSILSEVQIGTKVQATIKDKVYNGNVIQNPASAPYTTDKDQQEKNGKTLIINLDNLPDNVTMGNTADIVITTAKKDNTPIIPRSALSSFLGRDFVHVLNGEIRSEVDVETGIESSTEVEITKGLKEGQKVIINGN